MRDEPFQDWRQKEVDQKIVLEAARFGVVVFIPKAADEHQDTVDE